MNKQIKIGIIISSVMLLLVLGFAGLNYYLHDRNIIKVKDPQLSQENIKIYEDRLSKINESLKEEGLSTDAKYDRYLYKGFQLQALGRLYEAYEQYEKARELKPDMANAYLSISLVLLEMNDNKGAAESIKKAIELRPDSADYWKRYILIEKEKFNASNDKLNDLYVQALNKTGENIDMITVYAQFLEEIGNLQPAKEYWQKAIEANPDRKALYQTEIKRVEEKMKQLEQ
jgi:tetratricopeptide (TPR) repeat protein